MKLIHSAAAVLALAVLTGCAATPPTPNASPTAIPTSSASQTPEPTDTPAALGAISMDATGLTLLGASGEQMGFVGFLDDPTDSLGRLTEALGAEPVIELTYTFTGSGTPTTVYSWGGLLLQVSVDPERSEENRMGANFLAPYVGTVRLLGPDGVSVGDAMSGLPAPISIGEYEGSPARPRYLLGDPVPVTTYSSSYDEYVQGFDDPATGTLAELLAPVDSFDSPTWRRFG